MCIKPLCKLETSRMDGFIVGDSLCGGSDGEEVCECVYVCVCEVMFALCVRLG